MKRVPLVLVLLVTLSLVSAAVFVPGAYADTDYALTISGDDDSRSGDSECNTLGSSGDPTGMGTGDGMADEDDPFLRITGSELSAEPDPIMDDYLLYLLAMIQLLAL